MIIVAKFDTDTKTLSVMQNDQEVPDLESLEFMKSYDKKGEYNMYMRSAKSDSINNVQVYTVVTASIKNFVDKL